MKHLITILVSTGIILALSLPGCVGGESESGEHEGGESAGEHGGSAESGEHDGEGEGESDGDGEESGTQFGLNDTFDEVRAGARLKLSYDSAANAFTGRPWRTTLEPRCGESGLRCTSQTGPSWARQRP